MAGVWAFAGRAARAGCPGAQRALSAGGDAPRGLVMEPDEFNGSPTDAGHRGGLRIVHATGAASPPRRPDAGLSLRGARVVAVRRDGHRRLRFACVVQQCWHGQPRPGLRRRHRVQYAHRRLYPPCLVAEGARLKTLNLTGPRREQMIDAKMRTLAVMIAILAPAAFARDGTPVENVDHAGIISHWDQKSL